MNRREVKEGTCPVCKEKYELNEKTEVQIGRYVQRYACPKCRTQVPEQMLDIRKVVKDVR
jgi:transposase-like protein